MVCYLLYLLFFALCVIPILSLAVVEKSRNAYLNAVEVAKENMSPAHPIRLGLSLNFAVFYYEIDSSPDKACALAQQSFDDGLADADSVEEALQKDSTMILQLLRDNLNLWNADNMDQGDDEPAADEGADQEEADQGEEAVAGEDN
jgi:14-3-3 protein epsilon